MNEDIIDSIDYCYRAWSEFLSPNEKELEIYYKLGLEFKPRRYGQCRIICIETGEIYGRPLYLAQKLGYSENTIYYKMKKNEEFRDGYHYKRLEE